MTKEVLMCFRPAEADAGVHPVACGGCGRNGPSCGGDPAEQMPVLPRALGRERLAAPAPAPRPTAPAPRPTAPTASGAPAPLSGPGAEGPVDPRRAADARHGEAAITHCPARLTSFRTNPRYPHRHGSREKGERKDVTTIRSTAATARTRCAPAPGRRRATIR